MIIKFGKYKGQNIESVDDNYLSWIIDAKQKELTEFHKEFIRRNPNTPATGWYHPVIQADKETVEPPLKVPPQTSEGRSAFSEPINFGKEDLAEEEEPDELMLLTKAQAEELVTQSYTSGYNAAYGRVAINVKNLPYGSKFRDELLQSIYENMRIDPTKFRETQDTTKKEEQAAGGDHNNNEKTKKKPWSASDMRKKF